MPELAAEVCPACDGVFSPPVVYCLQEVRATAVYLDVVMLLNFIVDFLLLMGAARLSGGEPDGKRTALAAALGGIYSGLYFLPGLSVLAGSVGRAVSLGLMSVIAFGFSASAMKQTGIFLLLFQALGGLALSLERGAWVSVLLAAGSLWLLCLGILDDVSGYIPLELAYGENTLHLTALRDTGNALRDPITGEQVLVISAQAAGNLTGLTPEQLRSPLETLACRPVPGLRLIPYRAVGTAGGFLLGLRLENARIGKRRRSVVAAFAPDGLDGEERFQALAGGML